MTGKGADPVLMAKRQALADALQALARKHNPFGAIHGLTVKEAIAADITSARRGHFDEGLFRQSDQRLSWLYGLTREEYVALHTLIFG